MRRIVLYFVLLGILSGFVSATNAFFYVAKIKVLSSIKPIQSIVLAIAGEHVDSEQLIPDYASPHSYAFKPSDLRKIKKADIIFRIDEHFEAMLSPVFKNVADQSKIISLADNPEIHFLAATGSHSHESAVEKENDSKHQENRDMHIFTSPKNVLLMAKMIAGSLSQLEPNKKGLYEKNLQAFTNDVNHKVEMIKQDFKDIDTTPYFVFHNSWQYFGEYFGLQKPEVLNVHEGITAGVKTILESRREIVADNVHCVFSDPSVSHARASTLTENLNVKMIEIDILQSGLTLDGSTYLNWLEAMQTDIKSCLSYGM